MKMTYFKYWIQQNNIMHRQSILPILNAFCSIDDTAFRQSFLTKEFGDTMLLHQLQDRIFLFLVTKDDEIIKAVDPGNNFHDIYDELKAGDRIAFASYIYVDDLYYGIASTFHGPRNGFFSLFIRSVLGRLQLRHLKVESEALPTTTGRDEVLEFQFKGETHFEIGPEHPWFSAILGGIFDNVPGDSAILSVTLKPARKAEMRQSFDNIINNIPDEGLQKLAVKGKPTLEDNLEEFYIIGTNLVQDYIEHSRNDAVLCASIRERVRDNHLLLTRIEEFRNEERYEDNNIPDLTHFYDVDSWRPFIAGV